MITPALPMLLAAILVGAGFYGVLARRHAVLMLVGVELVLAGAGLVLVTLGSVRPDPPASGPVLVLFLITIAAAEIVVALAVILALFRARGHVDLQDGVAPSPVRGERPAGTDRPGR